MFKGVFDNTVYVRVYKNRFRLRHIESQKDIILNAEQPFTTERLIIGQFKNAEKTLIQGIKEVYNKKWITPSPKILIQQMEMNEGGLSDVEDRILKEISTVAGARAVLVWSGKELTDNEVLAEIQKI